MERRGIAERQYQVMQAAADRWDQVADRVAVTAGTLRRYGRAAATSPGALNDFLFREIQKPRVTTEAFLHERIIGHSVDFAETAPDADAERAGQPVARIVDLGPTGSVSGFATGFLVAPGLIVTNWHVFGTAADVAGCGAQFGYELVGGRLERGSVFELDAAQFFFSDETLDVAIVGVNRTALDGTALVDQFGFIAIDPAPGKYIAGNPINIIQYPDGESKRWATTENGLYVTPEPDDLFLQYATDTRPGSSGSPAFNHVWDLVAVHHSGVPRRIDGKIVTKSQQPWDPSMSDDDIDWVANEGVRISKIYALLTQVTMAKPDQQTLLRRLLDQISTTPTSSEVAPVVRPAPIARVIEVPNRDLTPMTVSIVVNGTANFYANGQPPQPSEPVDRLPLPTIALPSAVVMEERTLRFDPDYASRSGYSKTFLPGYSIKTPSAPTADVLRAGSAAKVLKYHHYSLVMHGKRKLAMWTAANADYDPAKRRHDRKFFGSDTWKADPRIPGDDQLEDTEYYAPARKFDRGHLVRRDDVAWGIDEREEEYGNSDSFHWTNCTPQHEYFNRDVGAYHGLWGQLENHITKQLKTSRCILFAGPVLADSDPVRHFVPDIPVQVPIKFWKVVVAVETNGGDDTLRAYGFVLSQQTAIDEHGWETTRFDPTRFKEEQRSLKDITAATRVTFENDLHAADPLAVVGTERTDSRPLRMLADVVLR